MNWHYSKKLKILRKKYRKTINKKPLRRAVVEEFIMSFYLGIGITFLISSRILFEKDSYIQSILELVMPITPPNA